MVKMNRRKFLASSTALGLTAGVSSIASMASSKAWAADTDGYKALVCILLKGGMDQSDTLLPFDRKSYDALRDARQDLFTAYDVDNPASIRNRSNLLRINPTNSFGNRKFALPPAMPSVRNMFEGGDAAIVSSLGPLIEPVTRAQIADRNSNIRLPARLFSHNDQQVAWMTLQGDSSRVGWGGRFADAAMMSSPIANPTFAAIGLQGDVFLSANTVRPLTISTDGATLPLLGTDKRILGNSSVDKNTRENLMDYFRKTSTSSNHALFQDLAEAYGRGTNNAEVLNQARAGLLPFALANFPDTKLGKQLKAVAETISLQNTLNINRQVFFVSIGGWDTHSNQATDLAALHAELDGALGAFKQALVDINRWNDVVTFTASDFGRTLPSNGDGSDHGWGGHHFVMGGAVNGKQIYGDVPGYDINSGDYTASRGRLIPTTSVEQYAATMGRWFGLTEAELHDALPNLSNFSNTNLGFV